MRLTAPCCGQVPESIEGRPNKRGSAVSIIDELPFCRNWYAVGLGAFG
jgi:hypothetical protein